MLCLGRTATAHAQANDFTFTFSNRVIGAKEFDLKNKHIKTTNYYAKLFLHKRNDNRKMSKVHS